MIFPRFTGFVRTFVFICTGVFLLEAFAKAQPDSRELFEQLIRFFGLVPELFWQGMIYQGVTWIFFHGDLTHLLFNMLGFWMFGSLLQDHFGDRKFMTFVFVTGFLTAVVVAAVSLLNPLTLNIPTIGASGVVFAVLVAIAQLYPNQMVLFMFIFPLKMKVFAYLLIAIEFYALWTSNQQGVSNLAHLSGALVGWIFIRFFGDRGGFSSGSGWWRQVRERWHQRRMRKKLRVVRLDDTQQRWN